MRTFWIAVLALLVGSAGGSWYQSEINAVAQDIRVVTVHAYTLDSGVVGQDCLPDSLVSEVSPWRQMIVTDADGSIVGYLDLRAGEYRDIEGQAVCTVTGQIEIPFSPFYTFEIEGMHKRTISIAALDAVDWELFAQLS